MTSDIKPSEALKVNVVKALDDSDFQYAKHVCDNHTDWNIVYDKKLTKVWIKSDDLTKITNATYFKVQSQFPDVSPEIAYDVLQDSEFRKKWDKYMLSAISIGYINPNNDICYYALKSFSPFKSRDFVMQRSWLDTGDEKVICGHSVWHDKFPPTKSHVRGIIYLTVYLVRKLEKGCEITYVTHSDPRGKMSIWFTNKLTKIVAPHLVKKLHKACFLYPNWKKKHNLNDKPWYETNLQHDYPRINLEDCQPKELNKEVVNDEVIENEDAQEDFVVSEDDDGENEYDNEDDNTKKE